MKKVFAIVYENKMLENISCGGVAPTRELAEKLAESGKWFYDRYTVVEVEMIECEADLKETVDVR